MSPMVISSLGMVAKQGKQMRIAAMVTSICIVFLLFIFRSPFFVISFDIVYHLFVDLSIRI